MYLLDSMSFDPQNRVKQCIFFPSKGDQVERARRGPGFNRVVSRIHRTAFPRCYHYDEARNGYQYAWHPVKYCRIWPGFRSFFAGSSRTSRCPRTGTEMLVRSTGLDWTELKRVVQLETCGNPPEDPIRKHFLELQRERTERDDLRHLHEMILTWQQ